MAQSTKAIKTASQDPVVRYRVSKEDLAKLSAQAKKYGMSPSLYARQLALDALHDSERARLLSEVEMLQTEVTKLSGQIKTVNKAVLFLDEDVRALKAGKG